MIKKFGKTFLILLFLNELSPSQVCKTSQVNFPCDSIRAIFFYLAEICWIYRIKKVCWIPHSSSSPRNPLPSDYQISKVKVFSNIEYEVNGFYHSSELFFNPVELTSRRQFYNIPINDCLIPRQFNIFTAGNFNLWPNRGIRIYLYPFDNTSGC